MSTNDTTTTDTTLSANSTPLLTVITDQPDYSPGMVATFTASNAGVGDTLEFTVAHVEAGADGIIGTADDVLAYDISGTGTTSTVTDGGAGDLDGIANGVIVTNWAVNQDAFGQTFLLTAFDETTGTFATTTFTDAKLSQANFTYTDQTSTVFDLTSPVQAPNGEINFNNGALGETTPFGNVSGSGNFQPFVRISTNIGQEEGYNSTAQAAETIKFGGATVADDLVVNGVGTPVITLASLGDIVVGPTAHRYYEFTLDANQNNKALISLDEVQIYQSSLSTLGTTAALQYDPDATLGGTGTGFGANATLVYNLDSSTGLTGSSDKSVWIDANSSGSGRPDFALLVDQSFFDPSKGAYIYFFSAFGGHTGTAADGSTDGTNNSGFEEWSAYVGPKVGTPSIGIAKTAAVTNEGDGHIHQAGDIVHYTVTVTNTGGVDLTGVAVTDQIEAEGLVTLGVPGTPGSGVTIVSSGGGTPGDTTLSVNEVWTYTFNHTVTSGEFTGEQTGGVGDQDHLFSNVASVTTTQTPTPVTASASVAGGTASGRGGRHLGHQGCDGRRRSRCGSAR